MKKLKGQLDSLKKSNESYEDIIEDLLLDKGILSPRLRKECEVAEKQISEGNFITQEELKQKLNL